MKQINKVYIINNPNEIYRGLAFEQVLYLYAVDSAKKKHKIERVLCVWRSKPAVVIGRNQNPLIECNYPFLRESGINLARRDSGGGTVYQDERNLNFCFIQDDEIDVQDDFQFLLEILAGFGFECSVDEKNNVKYKDKKISGSAFRYGQGVHMHHFTLLLDADLDALHKSLHPEHGIAIESVGIASNRMPVTNIQLSVGEIEHAIQECGSIDEVVCVENDRDMELYNLKVFHEEYARLQSPEWIFERTPNFVLNYVFDNQSYYITVKRGKIISIQDASQEVIFQGEYHFFLPEKNKLQNTPRNDMIGNIIKDVVQGLHIRIFGD